MKKVSASTKDTVYIHDTIYINREISDWQKDFGLSHKPEEDSIWGKPVASYLDDKECNAIAFDFYYGYMHPTDNGPTTELMKLACTDNKKLRPFYRWCLDKTIQVSYGALTELTGVLARQYAEKYPDEFFQYIDSDSDITNTKNGRMQYNTAVISTGQIMITGKSKNLHAVVGVQCGLVRLLHQQLNLRGAFYLNSTSTA